MKRACEGQRDRERARETDVQSTIGDREFIKDQPRQEEHETLKVILRSKGISDALL